MKTLLPQKKSGNESDAEEKDSPRDSSEDDSGGEVDLVLAILNKEPYEPDLGEDQNAPTDEEGDLSALLASKMRHLSAGMQKGMTTALKQSDIIALDISGLRPADDLVFHSFELTDDTPIRSQVRRMAPKHNAIVRKEVDELLSAGVITPSSSAWSFPVVIATKKDGRPRFCVNYRQLNRVMKPDRWPLPKIEEIFDDLRGSKVFTTRDL